LIAAPPYDASVVDGSAFDSLSARASTKVLAEALDRALDQTGARRAA
jgi:hypothetical protein